MAFGILSRHWSVWRAAWQAERGQSLGSIPGGRSTEFLPAVLEIQQAPPSPIGRAILWTIMAVFKRGPVGDIRVDRHRRDGTGQDYSKRLLQGDSAV